MSTCLLRFDLLIRKDLDVIALDVGDYSTIHAYVGGAFKNALHVDDYRI